MEKLNVQYDVGGIEGLCVVEQNVFLDNRGYFTEVYNRENFINEGLSNRFVQDNEVFSKRGVLRGMHVNVVHPQGKLIRVISGEIFDVVVDLRKDSKTYGRWHGICLSGENKKQLYIPEGFGHGYLVVQDAYVVFKVTSHYVSGDERCFSWKSKESGIDWPISGMTIIQNEKDACSKDISEVLI